MRQYTEKELEEKIKAFLTSKIDSYSVGPEVHQDRKRTRSKKTSLIDMLIPIQFKAQW